MNSIATMYRILTLSFLLFIPFCHAGDSRFNEAASLVQSHLQVRRHRFLKGRRTETTSKSEGCTNSGPETASCCTPSDTNVCCDGDSDGNLVCMVSNLKFDMKNCAGTQCTECDVSGMEAGGEYEDCGRCSTCPDGSVTYECLNFAYSC